MVLFLVGEAGLGPLALSAVLTVEGARLDRLRHRVRGLGRPEDEPRAADHRACRIQRRLRLHRRHDQFRGAARHRRRPGRARRGRLFPVDRARQEAISRMRAPTPRAARSASFAQAGRSPGPSVLRWERPSSRCSAFAASFSQARPPQPSGWRAWRSHARGRFPKRPSTAITPSRRTSARPSRSLLQRSPCFTPPCSWDRFRCRSS